MRSLPRPGLLLLHGERLVRQVLAVEPLVPVRCADGRAIPYQSGPGAGGLSGPRVSARPRGGSAGSRQRGRRRVNCRCPASRDRAPTEGKVCVAILLVVTIPAVFVGIPLGVRSGEGFGGPSEFLPSLRGTVGGYRGGPLGSARTEGLSDVGLIGGPISGLHRWLQEISNAVVRAAPPFRHGRDSSAPEAPGSTADRSDSSRRRPRRTRRQVLSGHPLREPIARRVRRRA